jgi:flagellar hook assembly protein FlgD
MFELSPQNMKNAKLEILNSKGQTVRTFSADNHPNFLKGIVVWDGKDEYGSYVSSGMYFCNLNSEEYSESKKMILLK